MPTIATLGPKGTFSYQASLNYCSEDEIIFANTIVDAFELVLQKKAQLAMVPIENSIAGTVGQTLDCLMHFDMRIKAESILQIRHNLASLGKISLGDIKRIYLHPQTYEQCSIFIRNNLADAEIIETSSNAKSAQLAAKSNGKSSAAIIPKIAADIYGLKILGKDVHNSSFNVTRFFLVSNDAKNEKTGKDKTSIAIHPKIDKPGLLYEMLGRFAKNGINLTKIESRPSKGLLGDYIFFIDFEGHESDAGFLDTLNFISTLASVKILGSYPRKY